MIPTYFLIYKIFMSDLDTQDSILDERKGARLAVRYSVLQQTSLWWHEWLRDVKKEREETFDSIEQNEALKVLP